MGKDAVSEIRWELNGQNLACLTGLLNYELNQFTIVEFNSDELIATVGVL